MAGFVLLAAQLLALGEYHTAQAAGPEIAAPSTFAAMSTFAATTTLAAAQRGSDDARLAKAYRFERGGWIYVHLEWSPHDIGYQHGFLLGPEIADAFIEQYKEYKGIRTVTLTTAVPASDELKNIFISKIKREGVMKEVDLVCVVDEKIIGGFILEGNGRRVDASVAYDLTKIKNRFLTNEYIYRFR